MSSNPMNQAIRAMGNRSRALPDVPDIGQGRPISARESLGSGRPPGPADSPSASRAIQNATRIPQAQQPNPVPRTMPGNAPNQPPGQVGRPMPPGLANRPVPNPFQVETPGQPAPPDHYNYEPAPDGSWRVYPPGLPAPSHVYTASMPRAASTADYGRMRAALQYHMTPQPPV
jgi:hypothetical protein